MPLVARVTAAAGVKSAEILPAQSVSCHVLMISLSRHLFPEPEGTIDYHGAVL
jgi:hypothetical protein